MIPAFIPARSASKSVPDKNVQLPVKNPKREDRRREDRQKGATWYLKQKKRTAERYRVLYHTDPLFRQKRIDEAKERYRNLTPEQKRLKIQWQLQRVKQRLVIDPIFRENLRTYHKTTEAKWRQNARALFGGKCLVCSKTEHLEFHHLFQPDPENRRHSETWRQALKQPKAFILLCHRCHYIVTQFKTNGPKLLSEILIVVQRTQGPHSLEWNPKQLTVSPS